MLNIRIGQVQTKLKTPHNLELKYVIVSENGNILSPGSIEGR